MLPAALSTRSSALRARMVSNPTGVKLTERRERALAGVYRFLKGTPSLAIAPSPRSDKPLSGCLTWSIISGGKSKLPTFTAKAIAKYGPDCGSNSFPPDASTGYGFAKEFAL
jgi:hypothetical protein